MFTRDGHELSPVAELRGQSFRVNHADGIAELWLPAETITGIAAGQWLLLAFDRAKRDQHRRWIPPEGR